MARRRPGRGLSPRETVLAAVFGSLLLGLGTDQVIRSRYLARRDRLETEIRHQERLLARNRRLRERAEEIRHRYEAAGRSRAQKPPRLGGREEDVLRGLESLAEQKVHLLTINPGASSPGGSAAENTVSLEFLDNRGRLIEFLVGVVEQLGGRFEAFHASVGGQGGEIRCAATCVFPGPEESPEASRRAGDPGSERAEAPAFEETASRDDAGKRR